MKAPRGSGFFKRVQLAEIDERQEDKERNIIKKTLKQLRKDEEEANETHRNVDAKVTGTRSRLYRETTEDMHSWDQELGRPHHIMKRMAESLKLNGNYAVYLESTYRRGKKEMELTAPRLG